MCVVSLTREAFDKLPSAHCSEVKVKAFTFPRVSVAAVLEKNITYLDMICLRDVAANKQTHTHLLLDNHSVRLLVEPGTKCSPALWNVKGSILGWALQGRRHLSHREARLCIFSQSAQAMLCILCCVVLCVWPGVGDTSKTENWMSVGSLWC